MSLPPPREATLSNGDFEVPPDIHDAAAPFVEPSRSPNPEISVSSLAIAQLVEDEDFIKRTSRSSFRMSFVPSGSMDFYMDTPTLHSEVRPSSALSNASTGRSSSESRFDRSVSVNSSRTSTDSAYAYNSSRPSVSQRSASWDSPYASANGYTSPKNTTLLQPQRLNSPPRLRNAPGEAFRKLPREILIVVLDELRKLHLEPDDLRPTCATCWMRDVCSLSLTSRQLAAAARIKLYETIWLIGSDSLHTKKKFKMKYGTRLKLLRRTLRANPQLAAYVKVVKVPDLPEAVMTKTDLDGYCDMVASLIMSCPNLENVLDFHRPYNHDMTRLTHALSTRTKLTEHVWNITAGPSQLNHSGKTSPAHMVHPEQMYHSQLPDFSEIHTNWSNLRTLVLHCSPGGHLDPSSLASTIKYLPSLKHLALSSLSSLPATLLASLPPLSSLFIANLPGDCLTTQHLSAFAISPSASSITSLTLINTSFSSLPVLARLFANLTSLTRFTLQQDLPPSLPTGMEIYLHPYLASNSLKYLHWDVLTPNTDPSTNHYRHNATWILAKSISADGFPALRRIRAPCDYDGFLQSVCRPREKIPQIGSSALVYGTRHNAEAKKDSGVDLGATEETAAMGKTRDAKYTRSLRAARQAAQSRLDAARLHPRFMIIVEDWTDAQAVQITGIFDVAGFMGRVGTQVEYCLSPDVEGSDEPLRRVEDVIGAAGKGKGKVAEMCTGAWNSSRKGWEHRERERWSDARSGVKKLF